MKARKAVLVGLAAPALFRCAHASSLQGAGTPVSEADTLVGLALERADRDPLLLLYTNATQVPTMIYGRNPVQSLMREAPEVDSLLAVRAFQPQSPLQWQGVLSLSRPVHWVTDSLLRYWRQSPQGYREFRRLRSGQIVIFAVARPVFDEARAVAVLYVENLCLPLCDSGQFYVFTRDERHGWVVRRVAMSWVS